MPRGLKATPGLVAPWLVYLSYPDRQLTAGYWSKKDAIRSAKRAAAEGGHGVIYSAVTLYAPDPYEELHKE